MTNIAERNYSGQYYVNTRLGVAKTKSADDFPEFCESSNEYLLLSDLIEVNAKGFRGIVVTALTGLHLDESYDPLNNFYGCNPRSIFEGGIWYALQENGIPCGKSDPLNVAKNSNQLNEDWAQGRRPQKAAMAVVAFLRKIMASDKKKRTHLIDYFFYRLWIYSKSIEEYKLVEVVGRNVSRQQTGAKLVDFTLTYPESGSLPQYLVSQLLAAVFHTSDVRVIGGNESVFSTNTTSKKPADIWLETQGKPSNLYEVTVKRISKKRLEDSLDALHSTGHINHSVTFICRMEQDTKELDIIDGSYSHRGKVFDFVDYRSFCLSLCTLLDDTAFFTVLNNISEFVQDNNISMQTKAGWNEFFAK